VRYSSSTMFSGRCIWLTVCCFYPAAMLLCGEEIWCCWPPYLSSCFLMLSRSEKRGRLAVFNLLMESEILRMGLTWSKGRPTQTYGRSVFWCICHLQF
jgi:hypothetical protein